MAKHVSIKRTPTTNYVTIRDDDDKFSRKIVNGIKKLKGAR